MKNIKKKVSIYINASDSDSQDAMSIDEVIELIKNEHCIISDLTLKARAAEDDKKYKEYKRQLPMFAGSGIFKYRNDSPDNLVEYSNLLVVDFDHFCDFRNVVDFRKKLIEYADRLHIYAIWISPSADGIKAVMIHDNDNPLLHYNLFCQVKKNLFPKTEEFDMNCSNLSRTCFICHDPDVWINPRKDVLEPYHFIYDPSIQKPSEKVYSDHTNNVKAYSSEFIHTSEELEANVKWQNLWTDKQLINYADKGWRKEYPGSYIDGNRHKSILSRAKWLCLYGVLFENAKDYLVVP